MAVNSQSLLVNKVTSIVLVVIGFLILASGYRNESLSSMIGGCFVLVVGVLLLILTVLRRNRSNSAG
jgi:uncharacterized membrane protein